MLSDLDLIKYQKQYAKLVVRCGLNFEKGSYVHIHCETLSEPDFIAMLVDECYNAGARYVRVTFSEPTCNALSLIKMSKEELCTVYPYQVEWFKFEKENMVVDLYVESLDAHWLDGVPVEKFLAKDQAFRKIRKPYREATRNKVPYGICSVPSKNWAKSIFPKLSDKDAIRKMWELILKCCHIDKVDAIKSWKKHCVEIDNHAKWLNSLKIKELHYTSKNGTDLRVGLLPNTHFAGTADYDIYHKREFYSNIPTEECFISPNKYKVNGIVYSAKPLNYDGALIEDFSITFKNGKAVKIKAKKNQKLLEQIINTDKNSCYIGEVALVPYTSPINQTGIIFQSILYDENASCHLALGDCYTYTHDNFEKLSKKELEKLGFNFSNMHVDFMIGSKDLNIVATTYDNKIVQIFKNGVFVK